MSGALAFLSSELETPVETLPITWLDLSALPPERAQEMPRYAKALGLALSLGSRSAGLNLRRGPLAYERGFSWVREKMPYVLGMAVVILVSFAFSGWAQLYAKGKEKTALEHALGSVTKDVLGEETESAAHANELLAAQTAINDEDPLPHADAFDVMVKLSEEIPPSMTHDIDELDVQKGHVVVHGIVGSIPDAPVDRGRRCATERCFTDVKITRTNQVVRRIDRQKYTSSSSTMKCPEDVHESGEEESRRTGTSSSASTASSAGGLNDGHRDFSNVGA